MIETMQVATTDVFSTEQALDKNSYKPYSKFWLVPTLLKKLRYLLSFRINLSL